MPPQHHFEQQNIPKIIPRAAHCVAFFYLREVVMSSKNKAPYFVNNNLNSLELEDWLLQQSLFVARYNKLKKDKAALLEQLKDIDEELAIIDKYPLLGTSSLPWDPNPLLKIHQADKN